MKLRYFLELIQALEFENVFTANDVEIYFIVPKNSLASYSIGRLESPNALKPLGWPDFEDGVRDRIHILGLDFLTYIWRTQIFFFRICVHIQAPTSVDDFKVDPGLSTQKGTPSFLFWSETCGDFGTESTRSCIELSYSSHLIKGADGVAANSLYLESSAF